MTEDEGSFRESDENNGLVFGKEISASLWMTNDFISPVLKCVYVEKENAWRGFLFNLCQVRETEQLVQQLKEESEKEENNYKHQEELQLCQVSHECAS